MFLLDEPIEFKLQAGIASPVWHGQAADGEALLNFAIAVHRAGGRLAALWGSDERPRGLGFRLHCVFGIHEGHAALTLELPANSSPTGMPVFPDLSGIFPAANRMQRATRDLLGIAPDGGDQRPWLRHGAWPENWYPLRFDAVHEFGVGVGYPNLPSDYEFVQVGGEGAHEIPVGPIHAGIIEPGHFRFSVIGEKVLRLEQRLGYQHKGVEHRLIGQDLATAGRLIGRVSGDSSCAYAWAYAAAVEAACGAEPPPRGVHLRAILLERERVANHLGDLGALGNDAALAFGLTQFLRLKEDWLRVNDHIFGHRYLMDRIVPGGVAVDISAEAERKLIEQCDVIDSAVAELRTIYDEHSGLQDRFLTTGRITQQLAKELSLTGMAARCTGILLDGRCQQHFYTPPPPYADLAVRMAIDERGDVAARVAVRFDEITESLRLIRALLHGMPAGERQREVVAVPGGAGVAVIEGWRGEVLVGVQLDAEGLIARAHPHDPSWQIWPALEHAVLEDIVPDFPLINKSFNLSYSGVDL